MPNIDFMKPKLIPKSSERSKINSQRLKFVSSRPKIDIQRLKINSQRPNIDSPRLINSQSPELVVWDVLGGGDSDGVGSDRGEGGNKFFWGNFGPVLESKTSFKVVWNLLWMVFGILFRHNRPIFFYIFCSLLDPQVKYPALGYCLSPTKPRLRFSRTHH